MERPVLDLPTIGGRSAESVDSLERSVVEEQFTTNVHRGIPAGSRPAGHETGFEPLRGGSEIGDSSQLAADLENFLEEARTAGQSPATDRRGGRERPVAGRE